MVRCAQCGDVIGVYERLVVVERDEERTTSRAAEPQLSHEQGRLYHVACYAAEGNASAAEPAA